MAEFDRASARQGFQVRRLLRGEGLRLMSAAALVPPALLAIWFGSPWYDLMLIGAAAGMGWEWGRMTLRPGAGAFGVWGMSASAAGFVWAATFEIKALTLTGLLGIGIFAVRMLARLSHARRPWLYTLGLPVIAVSCACWFWLRGLPMGRETVFWLMGTVWATDTGAYCIGRMVGGPRLAPRISPNKTWAGLIGGVGSAAGAAFLLTAFVQADSARLAFLGAGLAIIAQMGDLAESALKRHVGVKDSGKLIPGHGGILDRVDGLMPVAAVLVGLTLVFGWRLAP